MAKFVGTFKDLNDHLKTLALQGSWLEQPNLVWKFRNSDGAGVLWSQTRKTLWFDGPPKAKTALQETVSAHLAERLIASERGLQLSSHPRQDASAQGLLL